MVTVRIATSSDIKILKDLANELVPASFKGVLTTQQIDMMLDKLYSQQALQDALDAGKDYFIASIDGRDVGVVSIIRQGPSLFLMQKIYMYKECVGQGVGTALLTKVKEFVRSKVTPATVELIINAHNPELGFYIKNGLTKVRDTGLDMDDFYISEEVYSMTIN